MSGPRYDEQERAVRLGLARTRADAVGGQVGALAKVEVERRLEAEAWRGFTRAVAEARAEGFSWEQIADGRNGAEAAEKLFESVAVSGSRLGERYVSWRCGDCDGLVLDHGPYGGHPADSEPGHRADCGRLGAEVSQYLAGIEARDADEELAAGLARVVTGHVRALPPRTRPIEPDGPGLEL